MRRLVSTYTQHIMPSGGGNVESILPDGYTQLKCIIIPEGGTSSNTPYFHDELNYNALDTIEVKYKPVENLFSTIGSNRALVLGGDNKRLIDFRGASSSSGARFMNYININYANQHITIEVEENGTYPIRYYEMKSETDDLLQTNFYVNGLYGNTDYSEDRVLTDIYLGSGVTGYTNQFALGSYEYLKITSYSTKENILHYVPALEDATGIAGFYDVVNNKFIAPKQGVAAYETL